ncbi:CRISPR-associated endonuclease Cas1 [Sphaerotilus uruguayifluvii]|uniref:Uncharacterized protein n=1 Tax=Sphaerotilus uruguayifluvii TaxID=2735897 RepID=A0ABX2G9A8_9BURK|nr:CRISPR-associated endonuclease Cas1 [Leptothrix sp. C29]NRT58044.1 hypothetical protein [Leptothrix sp. C29]
MTRPRDSASRDPERPRSRRPSAVRTPARAPGARTLYLASLLPTRVSSTGEALVVQVQGGQLSRIPIARVMRIVCGDAAQWSGAALMLCQQHGVVISWVDGAGTATGHLWSTRRRATDLAEALSAAAGTWHRRDGERASWPATYGNWLRQRRLAVLQDWADERRQADQPVGRDEWEQARQAWVCRAEVPVRLPALMRGLAAARVAAHLSDDGIEPHYWCVAADAEPGAQDAAVIALAEDLTELVWARMNLCAGALAAAVEQPRDTVTLFEAWSDTCIRTLQAHLATLRPHLLRELGL